MRATSSSESLPLSTSDGQSPEILQAWHSEASPRRGRRHMRGPRSPHPLIDSRRPLLHAVNSRHRPAATGRRPSCPCDACGPTRRAGSVHEATRPRPMRNLSLRVDRTKGPRLKIICCMAAIFSSDSHDGNYFSTLPFMQTTQGNALHKQVFHRSQQKFPLILLCGFQQRMTYADPPEVWYAIWISLKGNWQFNRLAAHESSHLQSRRRCL
jgi:hypothetical protein